MLLTVKRVIPHVYEVYYRGHHITNLIKTVRNDWRFAGLFAKDHDHNKAIYSLLKTVFDMRFKTKPRLSLKLK